MDQQTAGSSPEWIMYLARCCDRNMPACRPLMVLVAMSECSWHLH